MVAVAALAARATGAAVAAVAAGAGEPAAGAGAVAAAQGFWAISQFLIDLSANYAPVKDMLSNRTDTSP